MVLGHSIQENHFNVTNTSITDVKKEDSK